MAENYRNILFLLHIHHPANCTYIKGNIFHSLIFLSLYFLILITDKTVAENLMICTCFTWFNFIIRYQFLRQTTKLIWNTSANCCRSNNVRRHIDRIFVDYSW